MQKLSNQYKLKGKIGFVPTMGCLHEGHLSLVRQSKKETDFTVVSIFVNPAQFGPNEDFKQYPRNISRDINMLKPFCIDALFYPYAKQMYPEGFSTYIQVEGSLECFEGSIRPGHFKGVATVVIKFFNILKADVAYFGQKDRQQCSVIKRMVKDLNIDIKIKILPTVREKDGLAISSRNAYLTPEEHQKALCLYDALNISKKMVEQGVKDCMFIESAMKKRILREKGVKLQYANIIDRDSFDVLSKIEKRAIAIVAVRIGRTRLIDNIALCDR